MERPKIHLSGPVYYGLNRVWIGLTMDDDLDGDWKVRIVMEPRSNFWPEEHAPFHYLRTLQTTGFIFNARSAEPRVTAYGQVWAPDAIGIWYWRTLDTVSFFMPIPGNPVTRQWPWYINWQDGICFPGYYLWLCRTDSPCHLTARTRGIKFKYKARAHTRRGVTDFHDTVYYFPYSGTVEQNEPGDTVMHTFNIPIHAYSHRYYWYCVGTFNSIPSQSMSPIFSCICQEPEEGHDYPALNRGGILYNSGSPYADAWTARRASEVHQSPGFMQGYCTMVFDVGAIARNIIIFDTRTLESGVFTKAYITLYNMQILESPPRGSYFTVQGQTARGDPDKLVAEDYYFKWFGDIVYLTSCWKVVHDLPFIIPIKPKFHHIIKPGGFTRIAFRAWRDWVGYTPDEGDPIVTESFIISSGPAPGTPPPKLTII